MKNERFYKRVRAIFREHYGCAFRTDIGSIEFLDCLRYMATEIVELHEKELLKFRQKGVEIQGPPLTLKQKMILEIGNPYLRNIEICRKLGISPSTANEHIHALIAKGYLEKVEKSQFYRVKDTYAMP